MKLQQSEYTPRLQELHFFQKLKEEQSLEDFCNDFCELFSGYAHHIIFAYIEQNKHILTLPNHIPSSEESWQGANLSTNDLGILTCSVASTAKVRYMHHLPRNDPRPMAQQALIMGYIFYHINISDQALLWAIRGKTRFDIDKMDIKYREENFEAINAIEAEKLEVLTLLETLLLNFG